MRTLQEKKDCIKSVLIGYQSELSFEIDKVDKLSKIEEYDKLLEGLCSSLAKSHKFLLVKIQFCQNEVQPKEIKETKI